jgi:N6-L-threonylcarbamoyladenine synthase
MITLGIETSCDDTALSLIETRGTGDTFEYRIVGSLVHSQADLHSTYGGVYPALAKREHGKNLVPLLQKLFEMSGDSISGKKDGSAKEVVDFPRTLAEIIVRTQEQNQDLAESLRQATFLAHIPSIDRIAVTEGPGLEPALWVGISFARILSDIWGVPVVPVNHMEGHILGSLLQDDTASHEWQSLKSVQYPALALLISGGHTELVHIKNSGSYSIIGHTLDDAVGEAFDKAARLLGLPYPGGPHIARLAQQARELELSKQVSLPRPMIGSKDLNFSFSGLKTAVLYAVRAAEQDGTFDERFKQSLAREFEDAVTDTLVSKIRAAIDTTEVHALILGGGVSANQHIITRISKLAEEYSIPLLAPSRHVSGDNALMIALAGTLDTTTKTPGEIRAHGTKQLGFDR